MDFGTTEDHAVLRRAVSAFAESELLDDVDSRDRAGCFSRDLWDRCARFGIQGLAIPAEYGGAGRDATSAIVALETLGYGCADGGLLFGLGAQMWSVQSAILRFGTHEQKAEWLPRLCDGTWVGAHAMSEPGSGSDAFGLQARARPTADGYVLDGRKTFVTHAPHADIFLVFATLDPSMGALGVTAFLVHRDTPGLHVGRPLDKLGLRTVPMADVVLEGCALPRRSRLGDECRGAMIFNDSMEWERACIMAPVVGAMTRQLERCIRHFNDRTRAGVAGDASPTGSIATMKVRRDASRLLLYKAAWVKQRSGSASADAAAAKLFISEAWIQSCNDALRLQGRDVYSQGSDAEREMRDAMGSAMYSGTAHMQQRLIARALGLREAATVPVLPQA